MSEYDEVEEQRREKFGVYAGIAFFVIIAVMVVVVALSMENF